MYDVEVKKVGNKKKLVITTDYFETPLDTGLDKNGNPKKTERVCTSSGNHGTGLLTKDGREIHLGFNGYAYKAKTATAE